MFHLNATIMVYKFFSKSERYIKNHLIDYIRFAKVDGSKHPENVRNIIKIAEHHGMRGQEIKSLISEINPDKIKTPQTDDERFDQLFYLLNLVLYDDLFNSTEADFCNEIGIYLGYKVEKVPLIVREMYDGIKYELSEDEIKKNVTKIITK